MASEGKLCGPLGQLRLVPPQARQGLARAVCQTNLIGEAVDTPPSQYTGQWALSWYDIPHCEGRTLASQLRDPVASQLVGILACWLAIVVHPLGNSVCLGLSAHGASIAGSSRPAICHCHNLIYSITHLLSLPDNMQISANLLHQLAFLTKYCFFPSLSFPNLACACKFYQPN